MRSSNVLGVLRRAQFAALQNSSAPWCPWQRPNPQRPAMARHWKRARLRHEPRAKDFKPEAMDCQVSFGPGHHTCVKPVHQVEVKHEGQDRLFAPTDAFALTSVLGEILSIIASVSGLSSHNARAMPQGFGEKFCCARLACSGGLDFQVHANTQRCAPLQASFEAVPLGPESNH